MPQGLGTHKDHHSENHTIILDWDTNCVQNIIINLSQRQLHSKFDQNANVNSQATKTYSKNYKFEFTSTPSFPRSFLSRLIFFTPPFLPDKTHTIPLKFCQLYISQETEKETKPNLDTTMARDLQPATRAGSPPLTTIIYVSHKPVFFSSIFLKSNDVENT